jgi:hypothetical protein
MRRAQCHFSHGTITHPSGAHEARVVAAEISGSQDIEFPVENVVDS